MLLLKRNSFPRTLGSFAGLQLALLAIFAPLSYGQGSPRIKVQSSVSEISNDQTNRSSKNKEIPLVRFPAIDRDGNVLPAQFHFYIQAGLHGNETATTQFANWVSRRLELGTSLLNRLPSDKVAFDLVPIANPDGLTSSSRYNANHVNLNRNFSYLWGISRENPGNKGFSEPETRSIRYLLTTYKYTAAVDIHGYINWVILPTKPLTVEQKKFQSEYDSWFKMVELAMRRFSKTYELKTAGGLGDGGAFEDFAFWSAGIPAFCFELSSAFPEDIVKENGLDKKINLFEKYEGMLYDVFSARVDEIQKNSQLQAAN